MCLACMSEPSIHGFPVLLASACDFYLLLIPLLTPLLSPARPRLGSPPFLQKARDSSPTFVRQENRRQQVSSSLCLSSNFCLQAPPTGSALANQCGGVPDPIRGIREVSWAARTPTSSRSAESVLRGQEPETIPFLSYELEAFTCLSIHFHAQGRPIHLA